MNCINEDLLHMGMLYRMLTPDWHLSSSLDDLHNHKQIALNHRKSKKNCHAN